MNTDLSSLDNFNKLSTAVDVDLKFSPPTTAILRYNINLFLTYGKKS